MMEDPMETETLENKNGSTSRTSENCVVLRPVSRDESGEGLPYAPENWPNPGDNWTWKVGKRVSANGYFQDRYLYPPRHICGSDVSSRRGYGFASRLSVQRYVQTAFPKANIEAFFSLFSWRIPAEKSALANGLRVRHSKEKKEHLTCNSQTETVGCKAGNRNCISLSVAENPVPSMVMPCDICCSEPQFCQACCCILCSKTIDTISGGYNYIQCEAMVGDGYICGHLAHISCGLRSYMAGTVGGSIGLDAEYYCRRCDTKTDLVSHVEKILQSCESIDSRDEIEKILGIGVCTLRGSCKTRAKELLRRIELIIKKLKGETCLDEIWKTEENFSPICAELSNHANTTIQVPSETSSSFISQEWIMSTPFDHRSESLKLENEIDQVLQGLKASQEFEYTLAEGVLQSQKFYLQNLFQQLDKEQTELVCGTLPTESNAIGSTILDTVDEIKQEVKELKRMEKVADGFGRTPKRILKEDFGLEVEE